MKKSAFIALLAAAFCGMLAVGACAKVSMPDTTSFRYRMTVTVATPEGDKVGSSVREVTIHSGGLALPESHPRVDLKGEAVVVNLGKRGKLFALLGSDYASDLPGNIFAPHGWLTPENIKYLSNLKTPPVEVPPTHYPRFVAFGDLNNPMTVEDMTHFKQAGESYVFENDRLRTEFGEDVKLKSVTIEMVNDAVTWSLDSILPWLQRDKGGYLGGSPSSRGAPLNLSGSEFQQGKK